MYGDGRLTVSYRKPFDLISETAVKAANLAQTEPFTVVNGVFLTSGGSHWILFELVSLSRSVGKFVSRALIPDRMRPPGGRQIRLLQAQRTGRTPNRQFGA